MKKKYWIILGALSLLIIAGIIISKKSSSEDTTKDFVPLQIKTIENKQLISGRIQSSKEVNIKSELAGIIDALYVQVGDKVHKGQAIAKIRILPDPRSSQDAMRQVEMTKISMERIKANYLRNKSLYEQDIISKMEYETSLQEYKTAQAEINAAQNNLKIVRQGFSDKSDFVSNTIYSTIDGIVLDIPMKVGNSIQSRNNFSEGTTLATIADMNEFLFKGQVNEKDLKYIEPGKEINISISALKDHPYKATISKIAPKGIDVAGITRFDIEARLNINPTELYKIRSGFSATAEFTIQKATNVLAIEDKYIQYSSDTAFVYIQKGKEDKERKILSLGISDGQYTEVKSGLKKTDKVLKEVITEEE